MESKKLTSSLNDLLTYLNANKDLDTNSVEKKYKEMADERGCSTGAISRGIRLLESKGRVKREMNGTGKKADGSPKLMIIKII